MMPAAAHLGGGIVGPTLDPELNLVRGRLEPRRAPLLAAMSKQGSKELRVSHYQPDYG